MDRPAQRLAGKELMNGWKVMELIDRPPGATGGNFSSAYIVHSRNGEKAFLKAMDFRGALESPDPAKALEAMTSAYNFEKDLLEKCKSHRASRIVKVLDSGTLRPQSGDPSNVVQYLIFELAERDVRSFVDWSQVFDTGWALRFMHQAAAALQQLHSMRIAHQDVKPSNILIFADQESKLADLGCAFDRDRTSPRDVFDCAGDLTYAPPELLYGYVPADWRARRLGCDMYLLGSLAVFFFAGVSMTHLLFGRLDREHHHENWNGTYEEVSPYILHIFTQIIRELRMRIPSNIAEEVSRLIGQLCNPVPEQRGHPKNILSGGNQYSLERYVSAFDCLAKRAEWILTHGDSARRSK